MSDLEIRKGELQGELRGFYRDKVGRVLRPDEQEIYNKLQRELEDVDRRLLDRAGELRRIERSPSRSRCTTART